MDITVEALAASVAAETGLALDALLEVTYAAQQAEFLDLLVVIEEIPSEDASPS